MHSVSCLDADNLEVFIPDNRIRYYLRYPGMIPIREFRQVSVPRGDAQKRSDMVDGGNAESR